MKFATFKEYFTCKNKAEAEILKRIDIILRIMYRSIPKPPIPPPGQTPGHLTFLKFFLSNSPPCCQFRRSNAPPVRASKRVKSPTLQGERKRLPLEINRIAYIWKQVLQNFQPLRILVQLVFAPRLKQSHISRYNYIKLQQQQKNPRGIDKSNDPSTQLLFPTADRRFDRKVKCPTGRPSFGSNSPLYGA